MGRNRRQQRLRERRERGSENTPSTSSSGSRSGGGGTLSSSGKPAWRETIDSWGGFTVIGAIVAAVVVAGLLVYLNRPGASANDAEFVLREHEAPVDGAVIGNPDATVRIIQYGDFQCPHCEAFWQDIEPVILEEYVETGQATFEYRNYAFIGPESQRAAEAAACAADQNQFWNFHDLLFTRQGRENSGVFSDSNLRTYAETVADVTDGFDVDAWQTCFDNNTHEADILAGNQQAASAGVTSTPTVIINGQAISGVQGIDVYRNAIDAALASASS